MNNTQSIRREVIILNGVRIVRELDAIDALAMRQANSIRMANAFRPYRPKRKGNGLGPPIAHAAR